MREGAIFQLINVKMRRKNIRRQQNVASTVTVLCGEELQNIEKGRIQYTRCVYKRLQAWHSLLSGHVTGTGGARNITRRISTTRPKLLRTRSPARNTNLNVALKRRKYSDRIAFKKKSLRSAAEGTCACQSVEAAADKVVCKQLVWHCSYRISWESTLRKLTKRPTWEKPDLVVISIILLSSRFHFTLTRNKLFFVLRQSQGQF